MAVLEQLTGARIAVRFSSGTEPEQPLARPLALPCQRRIALPFITLSLLDDVHAALPCQRETEYPLHHFHNNCRATTASTWNRESIMRKRNVEHKAENQLC
jgi:hypothetical protein